LPVLSHQRVNPGDPKAIDQAVREYLAAGEPLYALDEPALRGLRPDVILTQDLCRVCSIDLETVRRVAATISPPPRVVSLNPTTVEAVLDDVGKVAGAIGEAGRGLEAVVDLRERLHRAQDHVNPYAPGPSVAFLEWTDPLFCAGHWTVQLIERAGGRHPLNPTSPRPTSGAAAGPQHAYAEAGASRAVSPEELVASEPEFLIVCPCGASLEQDRGWAADLRARPWWGELPAVREGRAALVDGNQMFNRPGPRLVDAFEFLVGWLQGRPELIPAGFPWELIG
jgi:ABC-type Fe3+-hydroxamate transport system substrate-binding protein